MALTMAVMVVLLTFLALSGAKGKPSSCTSIASGGVTPVSILYSVAAKA